MKFIRIGESLLPADRIGELIDEIRPLADGGSVVILAGGGAIDVLGMGPAGVVDEIERQLADGKAVEADDPVALEPGQKWENHNGAGWAEIRQVSPDGVLFNSHWWGEEFKGGRLTTRHFRESYPHRIEDAPTPVAPPEDPVALLVSGKRLRYVRAEEYQPVGYLPRVIDGQLLQLAERVYVIAFNGRDKPIQFRFESQLFLSDWNQSPATTAKYAPALLNSLGYRFDRIID